MQTSYFPIGSADKIRRFKVKGTHLDALGCVSYNAQASVIQSDSEKIRSAASPGNGRSVHGSPRRGSPGTRGRSSGCDLAYGPDDALLQVQKALPSWRPEAGQILSPRAPKIQPVFSHTAPRDTVPLAEPDLPQVFASLKPCGSSGKNDCGGFGRPREITRPCRRRTPPSGDTFRQTPACAGLAG